MTTIVKEYDSFQSYEMDESRQAYEVISLVHSEYKGHHRICADMMTECKLWITAINRFFKALSEDTRFAGWKECITESIENGVWADAERLWNPNTGRTEYTGGWSYMVEDHDGAFYVALTVNV